MKLQFIILATLAISCVHGQINKTCSQDNECDISNKFLCIQNFCRCKTGYRKVDTIDKCVLVPGTQCKNNADCDNFPGAICDDNKKCVCDGGYIAGKTECDSVGSRGDPCNNHAACVTRTRDTNTECINMECVCKAGFHQGSNFCIKSSGLEDQCTSNNDCHLIVNDQNALECTPEKICKCREGFTQRENTCNGSNQLFTFSALIMVFLTMGLIKL